jgi:cytochrome P450 family 135
MSTPAAALPPTVRLSGRRVRQALPPGPRGPAFWQTARLARDWVGFLAHCRDRYGGVFTVDFAGFGITVYVVDPDDCATVFQGDPAVFRAGEARDVAEPIAGPRSVLILDGEAHRRERRLLLPPFQGNHVRTHERTMEEATERELARWPLGQAVRARPIMQAITLDVILRAVFGADERACARLAPAVTRVLDVGTWATLATALPSPLEALVQRAWLTPRLRVVDALLHAHIRERRAETNGHDDVLSLLLEARDEEGEGLDDGAVRDELMTVLAAGHETTANALAWAIERLVRNPAAMERLAAELDEEPGGGPYLDAVVRETLRVRPVIADAARRLAAPVEVAGWQLPAGVAVAPALALVNLDPAVYPDPSAFRPERWLENSPPSRSWLPFGGGRRSCLGAGFAMFEMRVVLRTLLRRLALRAVRPEDERMKLRNITLTPARGAEVIASAR